MSTIYKAYAGSQRTHWQTNEQMRQLVAPPNIINCYPQTTSRDSPLPSLDYLKISGGIFHDCAVHDIDLITWILGEYPTEVCKQFQLGEFAQVPQRGHHHHQHHHHPGRVPHRGLQAISIARLCTAYQVFSAANSVIPEIGAINDWDNVAIVMKFSSGTLAQVKYCPRIGVV